MKKIVVVFLLLCSILLANSEYNIFVSAFGDDVTQESIERERADIERKVAKIDGVKAVVSVGGYSAAPASFAAIISCTPLFIHEQNAVIGNLNKL